MKGEIQVMEENKPEVTVLSVELSQAVQADALVESGMELAHTGITKICEGVKLMHDGKLYKQLGFQNFEEYCKSKGFTKRYGNQLVRIAKMIEENGKPVSHFENLGVAKLLQLATLLPEQREEIIQTVDVEAVSKRDLEKEIKKLKEKEKQSESKIAELESENQVSAQVLQEKQERIIELERQNQELENRPIETYHSEEDKQEIERLTIKAEALKEQCTELEQKVCAYESQEQSSPEKSPEYKNLMKAMHRADHEWSEKYDALQEKSWQEMNELKRTHQNELRRKEVEIEALQTKISEQSAEPEESPELKQFRIQLMTIGNSLSQLFDFLCDHPQDMFLKQSEKLFRDAGNSLDEIRKQVQT